MNRRLSIVIAAALVLPATLSTGAFAQSGLETRRAAVGYLDLDLATEAGRATLERRVNTAAEKVCGERPAPRQIKLGAYHRACVDQALTDSRNQMARLFRGEALAANAVQVGAPK